MNKKKFLFILLPIIVLLIFIYNFNKSTATDTIILRNNTVVKELSSPDKKNKAVAFIRDCGATTDFSPQVSLLKDNEQFRDDPGNLFVGYHSKFIDISWADNTTLVVLYDCKDSYISEKVDQVGKIKIKYTKVDKPI